MRKSLEQRVRDRLGAEGPQLHTRDYGERIDLILHVMTARDLLHLVSEVQAEMEEEMTLEFRSLIEGVVRAWAYVE